MTNSTSSKNYAKALADIAQDNVMSYNDIKKNLDIVSEILTSSDELKNVLENTTISNAIKTDIINEVFKKQINEKIINFLKILVDKSKFNEFSEIKNDYEKILDDVNNIKRVEVISAVPLTEEHKSRITDKLQNKLQKEVIPNWIEQPEIMGGLVIKIEDDVIDSSIKKKLENLEITI